MEYNQYWNEIKGTDEEPIKHEKEDEISFSYTEVPEEPSEKEHGGLISPDTYSYLDETGDDELLHDAMLDEENIFDEDEESADAEEFDDSKMYANSSLFDLIDELEDKEESEKDERRDNSRFVNFDFSEEKSDEDEKDVHIFADSSVLEEVDEEEDDENVGVSDSTPLVFDEEPEAIEPEAEVVEVEPTVEEPEAVEPEAIEPEVEETVEEVREEENVEQDIDQLIAQAKKKDEDSAQKRLLDSELLPLLRDIVSYMPGDSAFIDYVAKLGNDDRIELARVIEQARAAWAASGTDKMFSIPDGCLSIGVLSDNEDPMKKVQILENVGSLMYSYEKQNWCFVKLYFEDCKLRCAEVENINRECFTNWQWKIVQQNGYSLWKSRQK